MMERYFDVFRTACADIDATHDSGGARMRALIDRYRLATNGGTSLCLCVAFSTSRESLPIDVIVQLRRFREMMLGWIGAAFATGQSDGSIANVDEPEVEAAATHALLEGAQLAARASEDLAFFDNAVRLITQRLRG